MAERSKASDCKSADVCLRRFESYPIHTRMLGRASNEPAKKTEHQIFMEELFGKKEKQKDNYKWCGMLALL